MGLFSKSTDYVNMTDAEIESIKQKIFNKHVIHKKFSEAELDTILATIPYTQKELNLYSRLGYDQKEVDEENRKRYKAKGWLKYL